MHDCTEICDCCGKRTAVYEQLPGECESCSGRVCRDCYAEMIREFCCGAPDCTRRNDLVLCWTCAIADLWSIVAQVAAIKNALDLESQMAYKGT